jgi:hypothetical protein
MLENKEKSRRILRLLLQGVIPKEIAYRCECREMHVHRIKDRYLRRRVTYYVNQAGKILLSDDQLSLPLQEFKRKISEEARFKLRLMRSR